MLTVPANWRELLPDTDSQEFVHRIGEVMAAGTRTGRLHARVFVLDDDIDPADDTDLTWALATRIHPTDRAETWNGPIRPPDELLPPP